MAPEAGGGAVDAMAPEAGGGAVGWAVGAPSFSPPALPPLSLALSPPFSVAEIPRAPTPHMHWHAHKIPDRGVHS